MFLSRSYNNKTYRIDDIAWEQSPADSFAKKNGDSITFMDYYKNQYNIAIRHAKQPLLVSMPRDKDKKRTDVPQGPVLLIPELCALTGKAFDRSNMF